MRLPPGTLFLRSALVLAFALGAAPARAQLAEGGARILGLGRAGVALGGDAWGHVNPAAWGSLEERRAAVQVSQAFGISELRLAQLSAAAPTSVGTVAIAARTYGFSEHRETRFMVGFSRAVPLSSTRSFDVGVAVGYESMTTEAPENAASDAFGTVGTPLVSVGVQGRLVSGLRLGLAGRNLLGILWDDEEDIRHSLATVPAITAGLAYSPIETATLVLDAEQDLDFGLSVRGGVEAYPVSVLVLRAGVSSSPGRFSAGAGVRTGPLRADIAVESHESLGLTPAFGLDVSF